MLKKKIFVIIINHFDLAWRRCFDRKIEFMGKQFISYTDLQKYNILENLKLAKQHKEYKFNVETVAVMRNFIERNPDKLPELKKLVEERRLYIPLSGDNIIDTNMVLGESIVRNFVTGLLWTEEIFGYTPKLSVRNDAFGNSAQLPQILRGCGSKWVTGLSYSPCKGKYWRGLDGSCMLHGNLPEVGNGGGWKKYAPCPDCNGTGITLETLCITCDGIGIDRKLMGEEIYKVNLKENSFGQYNVGFVIVGGEELLPSIKTIEWVKGQKDAYDISFALLEESLPYIENLLIGMEDLKNDEIHDSVEHNPNNTGCYVSRIKTKQTARRQEYELLGLEALFTLLSIRTGQYPETKLQDAWRKLFFTLSHDSITGEHVDDVYDDLLIIWSEIDTIINTLKNDIVIDSKVNVENTVTILNLTGDCVTDTVKIEKMNSNIQYIFKDEKGKKIKPVETCKTDDKTIYKLLIKEIKPFSSKVLIVEQSSYSIDLKSPKNLMAEKESTTTLAQSNILQVSDKQDTVKPEATQNTFQIENERYLIKADRFGLDSIFDKKLNIIVSKTTEYRPGEYILEHDEGSPWATLSKDMERIPLSEFTRLVSINKEDGYQKMSFSIDIGVTTSYVINAFQIEYSVTLYKGLNRIEFNSNVRWDDYNHRLRIAMPVNTKGLYKYEIPYGSIYRESYEPTFHWAGSNGDWPAVNWAGVEGDHFSAAFFNKGTPSYRMEKSKIEGEIIFLSILRSPSIPTYLHEPDSYNMTKWDGMRDSGKHSFEYAFLSYDKKFNDNNAVIDGNIYNSGLQVVSGKFHLPVAPRIVSDNARISCIKKAEKDDSLIVRIVEYRGRAGKIKIVIPDGFESVYQVNLLEREDRLMCNREKRTGVTDCIAEVDCIGKETCIDETDSPVLDISPYEIVTLKFVQK